LFQLILKYFKDIAITNADCFTWFDIATTSIGDVQSHQKRVILFGDGNTCIRSPSQNKKYKNTDFFNKNKIIAVTEVNGTPPPDHPVYEILFNYHFHLDSHWYNEDKAELILEGNLDNLKAKQDQRGIFLIS
jgi:hypothetical protein